MASPTAKRQEKAKAMPRSPVPKAYRAWAAFAVAVLCFALLAIDIYMLPAVGLLVKILAGILALGIAGSAIGIILEVPMTAGLYILQTARGILFIDDLSKRWKGFWPAMAKWGLVLSFGLLSIFIFKKYMSRRMLAFGILSIIVIEVFILPFTLIPSQFFNTSVFSIQSSGSQYAPSGFVTQYLGYVFTAISVIGGFALYILTELIYIAAVIINGIIGFAIAASSSVPVQQAAGSLPGPAGIPVAVVPFLKPSIALPLILSLIVLVTLHEFSHGVLARQSRIRITSIGTMIFGIIPIGAFVAPDEKAISRLPRMEQDLISIAGVASNYLLSLVFFVPMILMYFYVMPAITTNGLYVISTYAGSPAANAMIAQGSILENWNGYSLSNLSNLATAAKQDLPYSTVNIVTSTGSYSLTANSTGKVGVLIGEEQIPTGNPAVFAIVNFFYYFFGISFLISFYLAVFNVLPIPMLDGYRVYKLFVTKRTLRALAIVSVVIFVLIFVPWIWFAYGL